MFATTTSPALPPTPAAPLVRLSLRREVPLALLPTATVLLLFLVKLLINQQLIFASLASSCFLIYLDPGYPANSARTLVVSQLGAAVLGYAVHAWLGPVYLSAKLALVGIIALMLTNSMHPSAVGTALNLTFHAGKGESNLWLFGLPVGLVLVLLVVQRASAYLLRQLMAPTQR